MGELIKYFLEHIEYILQESNNLFLLIDETGSVLDCNGVLRDVPVKNINQILVNSSYKTLFDFLSCDSGEKRKIKLNFIFKDYKIPFSCDCLVIPVKKGQYLISGEIVPALGQKEGEEYFKLTNELCETTRALQKSKFTLEKLNKDLEEKEESLKKYAEKLEDMVEERTAELKDAQEKLIRQEKLALIGQLTGSIGHEIKNPLNIISNATSFLKMYLNDKDTDIQEYMEMILSEVMRIDKIVNDLRSFSRIEFTAEKNMIPLYNLITGTMKRIIVPDHVKMNIDISEKLPSLYIDIIHIEQVLVNIIINACQAIDGKGDVFITAGEVNDFIFISVKDTGCGIGGEKIEKIFEPLFTTKTKGIGLGLAVTKKLVEINGGTIKVESAEGKGSTFTVLFPGGSKNE